jgi:hypothetical protein
MAGLVHLMRDNMLAFNIIVDVQAVVVEKWEGKIVREQQ